jgi:peptidoglycan/LPS O-acetylase OafA/YrhL
MDLYKPSDRKFRHEIEGLRAVAALLVAIYHVWIGRVSGGVDVFFVVSGFLITTSLLSGFERSNRVDIIGFLLRLSNRLFPAAFTVLSVITLASLIILPEVSWINTVKESIASAFYVENWQLARKSVDYLARNIGASPYQHFWAMSVQGQFYFIWAFLMLIAVFAARKIMRTSVRFSLLLLMIMLFIVSLAYSVWRTEVNQPWAYFDTIARVWEFALGGITALLASNIVLNRTLSFILGWLGLIGLVSCGVVLQVSTVFPGYMALYPTLCAVFIIIASNRGGSLGVHRFLSWKPLVSLGGISYGLYLWHWPVLILYSTIVIKERVNFVEGLMIIIVSIILAYLTTKYVENKVRKNEKLNTKWKVGAVSTAFIAVSLMMSALWQGTIVYIQKYDPTPRVLAASISLGAASFLNSDGNAHSSGSFVPRPLNSRTDIPRSYNDGCHQKMEEPEVLKCVYGVKENPKYTVALVGGSHSAQWLPSLEVFAEEESINILYFSKSDCRFTDSEENLHRSCLTWNRDLMEILKVKKPDLVFTTADIGEYPYDDIPEGYLSVWEKLKSENIHVFALRDNPWLGFDVPTCVNRYGPKSEQCTVEREAVLSKISAWDRLQEKPDNVFYADLSDYICNDQTCEPVVGNVLVYRDKHHITATYAKTLAPMLREEMMAALRKVKS